MVSAHCVAIFCEDIREEAGGTHTIIGVMPDNISLPQPDTKTGQQVMLGRLGIYIRVNLNPTTTPCSVRSRLTMAGGKDIPLGDMDIASVERAIADSNSRGFPMVGFIFKAMLAPFPIPAFGLAKAIVTIGEDEIVCGIINFVSAENA